MLTLDDERRLRDEAFAWLDLRTDGGLEPIGRQELTQFKFNGERLTLIDQGRGIRKPAISRAALTIMTKFTPSGRTRPYEDVVGGDGLPRYKFRADKKGGSENRGLLAAMELHLPVVWLVGVADALFQAIYPVYVIDSEPEQSQVVLAYDDLPAMRTASPTEEVLRKWTMRATRHRLHQRVFRSMVMLAYDTTCAVCSLKHRQLLDAAHIIEDRDPEGVAAVRNGIALCKIHHAAFDSKILGISPDLLVHIRSDILDEVDGPLLEYGIKQLHGQHLAVVPTRAADRPDRDLLDRQFQMFLSA